MLLHYMATAHACLPPSKMSCPASCALTTFNSFKMFLLRPPPKMEVKEARKRGWFHSFGTGLVSGRVAVGGTLPIT